MGFNDIFFYKKKGQKKKEKKKKRKRKKEIYWLEGKQEHESCIFYDMVYNVLIDRWNKNCTLLHCLAHPLNSK